MTDAETLARRILVEGHVQGVGYRQFAARAARRRGLSGWVRNRADGSVEALVSGPPDAVEALLADLRRGPLGADVQSLVLAETGGADWRPGAFEIRPSA